MFDIVLHEKMVDQGMTRTEAIDLIDALSETEFLSIEIENTGSESVAMGFIGMAAAEKLDYDWKGSGLAGFIGGILADMHEESDDHMYEFKGAKIWLSRE